METKEKEITVKEIFERLISLETMLKISEENNRKTAQKFTWYAVVILLMQFYTLILHILVYAT